jgi:hypothetical protein
MKIERGVRTGCYSSVILLHFYSEYKYLTKEALEEFRHFRMEEQVIHTVKYADEHVLLAKEETVLQVVVGKLIESGIEMNVKET